MVAHAQHAFGKGFEAGQQRFGFEIAHDLMAERDLIEAGQWGVKERLEIVRLPAFGDRFDDLVEIQVAEEIRLRGRLGPSSLVAREEDGGKAGRGRTARTARVHGPPAAVVALSHAAARASSGGVRTV